MQTNRNEVGLEPGKLFKVFFRVDAFGNTTRYFSNAMVGANCVVLATQFWKR